MPVILQPKYDLALTKSTEQPSVRLPYAVIGTESEADAVTAIEAGLPGMYNNLLLRTYTLEHVGGGIWDVEATYGVLSASTLKDATFPAAADQVANWPS